MPRSPLQYYEYLAAPSPYTVHTKLSQCGRAHNLICSCFFKKLLDSPVTTQLDSGWLNSFQKSYPLCTHIALMGQLQKELFFNDFCPQEGNWKKAMKDCSFINSLAIGAKSVGVPQILITISISISYFMSYVYLVNWDWYAYKDLGHFCGFCPNG